MTLPGGGGSLVIDAREGAGGPLSAAPGRGEQDHSAWAAASFTLAAPRPAGSRLDDLLDLRVLRIADTEHDLVSLSGHVLPSVPPTFPAPMMAISMVVLIGLTPKHATGRRQLGSPNSPMGSFGLNPIGRKTVIGREAESGSRPGALGVGTFITAFGFLSLSSVKERIDELKKARLGLQVSQSLLLRADRVIE
jgi:hypothetical protein